MAQVGRLEGRQDFSYMLWYDIVDSRSNRVEPGEAEPHDIAVAEFKRLLNQRLREVTIQARKHRATLHCWRGDLTSDDDGKHIFIAGSQARRWIGNLLGEFGRILRTVEGVEVRLLAVPCDFVGARPWRSANQPEVRGKLFLEHLTALREHVDQVSERAGDVSLLALESSLADVVPVPQRWNWGPASEEVDTTVKGLTRRTTIQIAPIDARSSGSPRKPPDQAPLWVE